MADSKQVEQLNDEIDRLQRELKQLREEIHSVDQAQANEAEALVSLDLSNTLLEYSRSGEGPYTSDQEFYLERDKYLDGLSEIGDKYKFAQNVVDAAIAWHQSCEADGTEEEYLKKLANAVTRLLISRRGYA